MSDTFAEVILHEEAPRHQWNVLTNFCENCGMPKADMASQPRPCSAAADIPLSERGFGT